MVTLCLQNYINTVHILGYTIYIQYRDITDRTDGVELAALFSPKVLLRSSLKKEFWLNIERGGE